MLATEHSKMGETRVLLEKGSVNDSDACCGYKQPLSSFCAKLPPESPFPFLELTHSPRIIREIS